MKKTFLFYVPVLLAITVLACSLSITINTDNSPTATPQASATPDCVPEETLDVPFTGGVSAVQTEQTYLGSTLITVTGTGQASNSEYTDAFYVFTDNHGNGIPPRPPDGWVLTINGDYARNSIPGKVIPPYRDDHVYTFRIKAPGGKLFFGVRDEYLIDNQGSYTVAVCTLP